MNVMECRELHHPIAQLETQGGHVVKWCGPNLSPSIDWPQACQLCGPNISNSASIRHRPNYVDVWPGLPLCIAPSLLHHSNICIHPSSVISHSNKFAHSSPGPCADNTTDGPGNHLHTPRVPVLLTVMSRAVPHNWGKYTARTGNSIWLRNRQSQAEFLLIWQVPVKRNEIHQMDVKQGLVAHWYWTHWNAKMASKPLWF